MTPTMDVETVFQPLYSELSSCEPIKVHGKVTEVIGLLIESTGPAASVGDVCLLERNGKVVGRAEVVGFRKERTLLMPLGSVEGIHPGLLVVGTKRPLMVPVGSGLLGRIVDGLGRPLDDKGVLCATQMRSIFSAIPHPLKRQRISQQFATGIRAIDTLMAVGKGQRMGIFAGSGVASG